MTIRYPIVSFGQGEVSPLVDARSDVDKYQAACRILENMIPRIYGPAERRPGTRYIDTCNGVARVLPFIYSNTIAYIVLLEDLSAYFYHDGGQVLGADGRRVKLDTPYLAADLFEIQYKQSNDVMWLVHGSYAPRKLSRTSATAFALDEIEFTNGPFMKRNDLRLDDGVSLTPSVTTGSGTLTASANTFAAGHVGALFAVTQPRVNTNVTGSKTAPATGVIGSSIATEGPFTITTTGTWTGTVVLQRSIDNATWETFKTWTGTNDRNIQETYNEDEDGVYYRVNVTALSAGTVNAQFTVNSSTQTGIGRVTGYVSPTVVNMTVVEDFASTNADLRWAEGCWSAYRGFPRCVTFFEDRAVYAGTEYQPQTVWFSATDDFENFDEGVNGDDAFSLTMSSDTRCAIQWITATEALIVGTSSGEWRIRSSSFDEPVTPTNFSFKQQTTHGSKAIQALPVNDAILFVDFVGRKVREASYDGNKDKYVALDLTALAEHITKTGITSIAFQKNPDPILWCIRADGTLLSLTYEREQNVIGWARHPFQTGGGVYGSNTVTTEVHQYPVLQELAASEIPTAVTAPADIPLASAISVTDKAGLQAMTPGNHYSIDADIDASGAWTPLSWNSSSAIIVEGNGHTISNLDINTPSSDYRGLIGRIQGSGSGQIRNLNFSNCTVRGKHFVGILLGAFQATGTDWVFHNINFTSCSVMAHDSGGTFAGAFYGNQAWIKDCNATASALVRNSVDDDVANMGGFIGNLLKYEFATTPTNIIDCHVVGGSITLSSSDGAFNDVGGFVGGVVGLATEPMLIFYNCTSSLAISITQLVDPGALGEWGYCGGFAGSAYAMEAVSCSASGGITIASPVNARSFDRYTAIGGFLGAGDYLNLTDCTASGAVLFTGTTGNAKFMNLGGFAGLIGRGSSVLGCSTTSSITIQTDLNFLAAGGFCGEIWTEDGAANTSVARCSATGDVTVSGDFSAAPVDQTKIGGFAGAAWGGTTAGVEIANCYTWSSLILAGTPPAGNLNPVGGFVARYDDFAQNTFTNCYCAQTDTVTGSSYTNQLPTTPATYGFGGFSSALGGTEAANIVITATYFDTETSSTTTSVIATGHLTDWLQTKSNFVAAGWDFDTIWYMPGAVTVDYSASGLGPNSVAVIASATEDEVWLVVARVIGGTTVRYLEQMQPREVDDQEDMWFVDSGLSLDTADADGLVSGLEHLEGEEVAILVDGAVVPRQTVVGGSVNVGIPIVAKCIVGLPFRYKLKPMRFDLQVGGGTKGTLKRFAELVVSFYRTLNAEYGTDAQLAAGKLFKINWRTTEPYGTPPALYTGDKVVTCEGGFDVEDSIVLTGDDPLPCVVRAMIPRIEVTGR